MMLMYRAVTDKKLTKYQLFGMITQLGDQCITHSLTQFLLKI